MTHIIAATMVVVIFWGVTVGTYVFSVRRRKRYDVVIKLVITLTRLKIVEIAQKSLTNGYISKEELNILLNCLNDRYVSLGENGYVETLIDQVKKLDITG